MVREELPIFDSVFELPLMVLFVSVSDPARVASVPEVGKVTEVVFVSVKVEV